MRASMHINDIAQNAYLFISIRSIELIYILLIEQSIHKNERIDK